MCRLLGVVSATPISVSRAVGEAVLEDFVALTRIHNDGWGVARVRLPGHDPRIEVSAGSACDDPHFVAATHDQRSAASMVHLRWATTGLAVRPENSHPFLAERIAMAHNGSIKPIGQLDGLLEPRNRRDDPRHHRQRALFRPDPSSTAPRRRIWPRRSDGPYPSCASCYPDASLNALILGEDQLIAVHAHARSRLPDEDIAEITAADLPAEHLEDYFGMRWARPDEDRVVDRVDGLRRPRLATAASRKASPSISMYDLSMATLPLMTPSTP